MNGVKVVAHARPTVHLPARWRTNDRLVGRYDEPSFPWSLLVISAALLVIDLVLIIALSTFVTAPSLLQSPAAIEMDVLVLDEVGAGKSATHPTAVFSR